MTGSPSADMIENVMAVVVSIIYWFSQGMYWKGK